MERKEIKLSEISLRKVSKTQKGKYTVFSLTYGMCAYLLGCLLCIK